MKTINLKYYMDRPHSYTGIVEYADGSKRWYLYGEMHREDGPAIEYPNNCKRWYLDGHRYSEEDYKKEMVIRNSTLGKLILGGNKFDLEDECDS